MPVAKKRISCFEACHERAHAFDTHLAMMRAAAHTTPHAWACTARACPPCRAPGAGRTPKTQNILSRALSDGGEEFEGVGGDAAVQDALVQQLRRAVEHHALKEEIKEDLRGRVEKLKLIGQEVCPWCTRVCCDVHAPFPCVQHPDA